MRKGKHGTTIVYADRFVPDVVKKRAVEIGAESQVIPFLKRFTFFNAAQCKNLAQGRRGRDAASAASSD